jgi:hypothetical protein
MRGSASLVLLLCLLWCQDGICAAPLQHELEVSLDPANAGIEVMDTITLPAGSGNSLVFALHPGLQPELLGEGAQLGEEYARSFHETRGMISPEGVFLAGSSHWYPHVENRLLSFDLELHLPAGWSGMSQGDRLALPDDTHSTLERWRSTAPQEEIYLIAGPFNEYTSTENRVQAMVLLRRPDPALARKYLDFTHRYIALYDGLIGPYPFGKFAMVENFWETGYGMPSFTLLGPKVIRLPFILHSSYPHEILHNWWGNGVYIDYESGNWAEGLTSYLADHLIRCRSTPTMSAGSRTSR